MARDLASLLVSAGAISLNVTPYILQARNAREALEFAKCYSATIHLLITDIVKQAMAGPSLAKGLAESHPETKVLYMTGYADLMDFDELRMGNCEFLKKPFMHHELMSKVQQVLGEILPH